MLKVGFYTISSKMQAPTHKPAAPLFLDVSGNTRWKKPHSDTREWYRRWSRSDKWLSFFAMLCAIAGIVGSILAFQNFEYATDIAQLSISVGVFVISFVDFIRPTYNDNIHNASSVVIPEHDAIYSV